MLFLKILPSITVTSKIQLAKFPCRSKNVYVTVVVPIKKLVPDVCDCVLVTGPEISLAIGSVHMMDTNCWSPLSKTLSIFPGQRFTVGGVSSTDGRSKNYITSAKLLLSLIKYLKISNIT